GQAKPVAPPAPAPTEGRKPLYGESPGELIAVVVMLAVIPMVAVFVGIEWHASGGYCPSKPEELIKACKAFIQTPQFVIWLLMLAAQAAFWALALVPVVRTVRFRGNELRSSEQFTWRTRLALAASAIVLALVASGFLSFSAFGVHDGIPEKWPLPGQTWKLSTMT